MQSFGPPHPCKCFILLPVWEHINLLFARNRDILRLFWKAKTLLVFAHLLLHNSRCIKTVKCLRVSLKVYVKKKSNKKIGSLYLLWMQVAMLAVLSLTLSLFLGWLKQKDFGCRAPIPQQKARVPPSWTLLGSTNYLSASVKKKKPSKNLPASICISDTKWCMQQTLTASKGQRLVQRHQNPVSAVNAITKLNQAADPKPWRRWLSLVLHLHNRVSP